MAPDAFSRFGIDRDELEKLIRAQAEVDDGINQFMEEEVVPYWRSVSRKEIPNTRRRCGSRRNPSAARAVGINLVAGALGGVRDESRQQRAKTRAGC